MSTTVVLPTQPRTDSAPPQVTTALHVETPENVVLNYQLAGPSARGAAYLIDLAIRALICLFLLIVISVIGASMPFLSTGTVLIALFVIDWFYYVFCECRWRGKSIGKHALGIRVIQQRGYPIAFWPSALRNFLRAADCLPAYLFLSGAVQDLGMLAMFIYLPTYGLGFLSMLLTKNSQRIGDLFAGTVVITERIVQLPREPIILERIQPLPRNEIGSSFVPSERTLTIVEQFLGRRFVLTHERGHALASILASRLAGRLDFRGDAGLVRQYPMAFLARVYVTFLKRADDEEEDDGLVFDSRSHQPLHRTGHGR